MKSKSLSLILCICMQLAAAQNSPVAVNDTFTISNSAAVLLPVLSNDYDIDGDPLTVNIFSFPVHGTATVSNPQISYAANSGFTGFDSLHYVICDNTSRCDTAVVFLIIIAGNANPVAVNDSYTVPEDQSTPLPVTGNDFDPEGDGLTVTILTSPNNGTTSVNGTIVTYTPNPAYFGTDTFVYVICDNQNACDTAFVFLTVTGVNSPPLAVDDAIELSDTVTISGLNLLNNDTDPENDSLFIQSVIALDNANTLGDIVLDSVSGGAQFIRNGYSCGVAAYTYVVCDGNSCDTGSVTITITCPDNISLPQGISPNGDGKNDLLIFTNMEYFGPASLVVYNRYGNMVYESEDYKNDWNGTYIENNQPLPDATYYYVLQLSNGKKYSNYVMINR